MKTIELKLGQFDFDDGGSFIGGCDGGKAHGYGVCTGPMGQGEFSGLWQGGYEISGVFSWSKDNKYAGQWMQGKRHGLGIENKGHWLYMGEWTQGAMGRYGVRKSTKSHAKYEGTWTQGLQDGYGLETYADLGTYQGQWMKGSRHGYGLRKSATYSSACFIQDHGKRRSSLTSIRSTYDVTAAGTPQSDAGDKTVKSHLDADMMRATKIGHFLASSKFNIAFKQIHQKNEANKLIGKRSHSALRFVSNVIKNKNNKIKRGLSDEVLDVHNKSHLKIDGSETTNSKQNSLNGSFQNPLFFLGSGQVDDDTIEIYAGEWKHDKRDGFGVCERSDGTKYEGEWMNNRRCGYGVTYYADGLKEEGRYKDDVLISDKHIKPWLSGLTLAKRKRDKERVVAAIASAHKAAQLANQKADITNSRMESARVKASMAEEVKNKAFSDSEKAKMQTQDIRRIEKENDAKKNLKKLTKKPSIPRHTMMNQNLEDQSTQPTELLNQTVMHTNMNQENHQMTDKLFKPLRPNSLKLRTNNAMSAEKSNITMNHVEGGKKANSISNFLNLDSNNSNDTTDHFFPLVNRKQALTKETLKKVNENKVDQQNNIKPFPTLMTFTGNGKENSNEQELKFDYQNVKYKKADLSSLAFVSNKIRRLTLPTIVKLGDLNVQEQRTAHVTHQSENVTKDAKNVSGQFSSRPSMDVLILDGGDRKVVEQIENKNVVLPNLTDLELWQDEKPSELPKIIKIHQLKSTKREELGSMPDVTKIRKITDNVMSWQDIERLSQQTRDELKRKKELELDLRKKSIVIRIGDFKCWLKKNCFLLTVIIINISIIYLFIDLLQK